MQFSIRQDEESQWDWGQSEHECPCFEWATPTLINSIMKIAANLGFLFKDLPFLERFQAAVSCGQWMYSKYI